MPINIDLRVTLIRHGESANNFLGQQVGFERYMLDRHVDPPITDAGVRQADLVATHLVARPSQNGELAISRIYVSPMWRCLQTAKPIGAALGIAPQVWMDIFEQGGVFQRQNDGTDVGFPGATRTEIAETFSGFVLPDVITDSGWWHGGHEDMASCHGRAIRVAEHLRQMARSADRPLTQPDEVSAPERTLHIALVTHGNFMDALIKALTFQLPSFDTYYDHNNTGMTQLDFYGHSESAARPAMRMRFQNRTVHLPEDLLTY